MSEYEKYIYHIYTHLQYGNTIDPGIHLLIKLNQVPPKGSFLVSTPKEGGVWLIPNSNRFIPNKISPAVSNTIYFYLLG